MDIMFHFMLSQFNPDVSLEERGAMASELHALSSAAKPVAGWTSRDAIQECREACGGHGYLRAAGIGRLRDDGDAFLTFEGTLIRYDPFTENIFVIIFAFFSRRQQRSSPTSKQLVAQRVDKL